MGLDRRKIGISFFVSLLLMMLIFAVSVSYIRTVSVGFIKLSDPFSARFEAETLFVKLLDYRITLNFSFLSNIRNWAGENRVLFPPVLRLLEKLVEIFVR